MDSKVSKASICPVSSYMVVMFVFAYHKRLYFKADSSLCTYVHVFTAYVKKSWHLLDEDEKMSSE